MITTGPLAFLPLHQAAVVLADPPWYFKTYSTKGWKKSAHAHYPCMTIEEITSLPVADLCADDCVLILWTTQNRGREAYDVAEAWGFAPKTLGAWAKQTRTGNAWQFGTGYLLRSAAEFFLVATRGHPNQLAHSARNLIVAPVREHSSKPEAMYELIETTWAGPYVELFSRAARPGWASTVRPWAGRVPALRSESDGRT
jgi:N6-adenosine-specific RNA methylase IME4